MDIYNFINSKAISAYCREIAHQFTPIEMAYLVHENDSINVKQKHEAYNEIIADYPDMEVAERPWIPYFNSLHTFLQIYAETENRYLSVFYNEESNCVYSYKVQYSGDDNYCEDGRLFLDFKTCYSALKIDIDDMIESYKMYDHEIVPLSIVVRKQWLNTDEYGQGKYMSIAIDYDNNPIQIIDTPTDIIAEDNEILLAFDALWIEVPTPFKKGDILVTRSKRPSDNQPFVLEWIPYWEEDERTASIVDYLRKNGDISDFATSIYGQDKDGTTWSDHGPCYLEMEYYEKELTGPQKFLIAVSNHIKGELPLELLIRSYDIFKSEYRANSERYFTSGFRKDLLAKAGLIDESNDTDE